MAQKYGKNMIFCNFVTAMATKLQQFTIGLCAAAMLSACSSGDATEKELNASRDAGRRQAEAALHIRKNRWPAKRQYSRSEPAKHGYATQASKNAPMPI